MGLRVQGSGIRDWRTRMDLDRIRQALIHRWQEVRN